MVFRICHTLCQSNEQNVKHAFTVAIQVLGFDSQSHEKEFQFFRGLVLWAEIQRGFLWSYQLRGDLNWAQLCELD